MVRNIQTLDYYFRIRVYLQLGEEKIKFIIDLRIGKTNAKERNETGQKRWKIENKVCNEEKSKNGLKHA